MTNTEINKTKTTISLLTSILLSAIMGLFAVVTTSYTILLWSSSITLALLSAVGSLLAWALLIIFLFSTTHLTKTLFTGKIT